MSGVANVPKERREYFKFLNKTSQKSKFQEYSEPVLEELETMKKEDDRPLHIYQIKAVLNTRTMIMADELKRLTLDNDIGPAPEPVLIVAPTGSGKSGMITILPYALASRSVLVLTPSHVITDQLATAFGYQNKSKSFFEMCGLLDNDKDKQKQFLEQVTVIRSAEDFGHNLGRLVIVNAQKFGGRSKMSLNSLVYRNEEIVKDVKAFFQQFDTLIVDEAHYYPAKTWFRIIEEFSKPAKGMRKKIIFLTATPYKNIKGVPTFILGPGEEKQKRVAYSVKETDIKGKTIRECAPLVEYPDGPHGPNKEFEKVYDHLKTLLDANVEREPRFTPQAMILVRLKKDADTLVKTLNCLNRASGRRNFAVAFVGDKKKGVAAEALDRFTKGEFQVGVTCGIAKDGYDNPKVTVCVILRKIVKGTILFNQFVGRSMRMHRGLPGPDRSVGVVMSYKEFDQRKLWEEREKYVAEEDPIDVDFDEEEAEKKKAEGKKRKEVEGKRKKNEDKNERSSGGKRRRLK